MNGNLLDNKENLLDLPNSSDSLEKESQPKFTQNNLFERISVGFFILITGLAYLFNFPSGTLYLTAGVLILVICFRQLIIKALRLDWLILIIGFLCLSKGISTLFNIEITIIPIFFCLLGIYVISNAWQGRNA